MSEWPAISRTRLPGCRNNWHSCPRPFSCPRRPSARSHREAEGARRRALIVERAEPALICASDPGLSVAALLGGDVTATRAWVAGTLGALAADTDNDTRLRETPQVFLGCGSSYKQAADELNLHFNSVKYRVGRAIARRGRDVGTDRLDVELALLACHWYGAAVLQPK